MSKKRLRSIFAVFLAVFMFGTSVNPAVFAQGEETPAEEKKTIASFVIEEGFLPEEAESAEDEALPAELPAKLEDSEEGAEAVNVSVSWAENEAEDAFTVSLSDAGKAEYDLSEEAEKQLSEISVSKKAAETQEDEKVPAETTAETNEEKKEEPVTETPVETAQEESESVKEENQEDAVTETAEVEETPDADAIILQLDEKAALYQSGETNAETVVSWDVSTPGKRVLNWEAFENAAYYSIEWWSNYGNNESAHATINNVTGTTYDMAAELNSHLEDKESEDIYVIAVVMAYDASGKVINGDVSKPLQMFRVFTSVNPNTINGGTISDSGYAVYGEEFTVTATPAEGYEFARFYKDGVKSTDNPFSFQVNSRASVEVTFDLSGKEFYTSWSGSRAGWDRYQPADGEYNFSYSVTLVYKQNESDEPVKVETVTGIPYYDTDCDFENKMNEFGSGYYGFRVDVVKVGDGTLLSSAEQAPVKFTKLTASIHIDGTTEIEDADPSYTFSFNGDQKTQSYYCRNNQITIFWQYETATIDVHNLVGYELESIKVNDYVYTENGKTVDIDNDKTITITVQESSEKVHVIFDAGQDKYGIVGVIISALSNEKPDWDISREDGSTLIDIYVPVGTGLSDVYSSLDNLFDDIEIPEDLDNDRSFTGRIGLKKATEYSGYDEQMREYDTIDGATPVEEGQTIYLHWLLPLKEANLTIEPLVCGQLVKNINMVQLNGPVISSDSLALYSDYNMSKYPYWADSEGNRLNGIVTGGEEYTAHVTLIPNYGYYFEGDTVDVSINGSPAESWIVSEGQGMWDDSISFIQVTHTVSVVHDEDDPVRENEVAATCLNKGSYDEVVYCKKCKSEVSRTPVTVPALGHEWGEWEVVKEPTALEEGLKQRVCAHDKSHVETEALPKVTYSVKAGDAQTWTKGSGVTADFEFERSEENEAKKLTAYDLFTEVKIDGKTVTDFTKAKGSVITKINPSYLDTLPIGEHTVEAHFSDGGVVSATFTIKDKAPEPKPAPSNGGGSSRKSTTPVDYVVTCQMAGYPANYNWNEAAKACQPGYIDAGGNFHPYRTAVRKVPNTSDRDIMIHAWIAMLSVTIGLFCAVKLLHEDWQV